MKRIVGGLVVTLTAMSAILFGTMTPANAAKADCPYGYFCLWVNTNFQGAMDISILDTAACRNLTQGIRNIHSSVYNNRPFSTYMYKNLNCSTGWLVSSFQSYSSMPSGWDNTVESLHAP